MSEEEMVATIADDATPKWLFTPLPARRARTLSWRRIVGLAPFAAAILGVALIAYFVLRPQGDDVPLSVAAPVAGHPAPDFTLRDIDGVRRLLHAQRGRAVLLNFWGINCPPCRHEMPEIWRAAQHLGNQPVTIWGIDDQSDAVSDMRLFTNQIGVHYPQLPDPRLVVGLRYQVSALPVNIFIGPNGRVTLTHVGPLTYPDFVAHLEAALREGTPAAPSR